MTQDSILFISLTTNCNLSCWHCPAKEWRGHKNKYPLKNSDIIPWLTEFFNPKKWVIELTGAGEPALYPEIEELCQWLSEHKFKTLIKTNGLIEIKPHEHIKRVAAFHQVNNPPKFFDEILIVDKIDREAKENICITNGWKYQVIGYNKEHDLDIPHGFKYTCAVNPAGHCVPCFARKPKEHDTGTDDLNRINHRAPDVRGCCANCKFAIDAWRFL